jgi:hypothetical protein
MQKTTILAIAVAMAANAQKISTEPSARNRVIRLQTTPNHLSVIELAEPVTEVAAGSSSYKIEWRDNKVFVQPLEPDAATNLFIWTATERLTYELVTVPSVADAQFAIDQAPSPRAAAAHRQDREASPDPAAAEQSTLASDILSRSRPIRLAGELKPGRVHILLKDIYRNKNRVYVRYAIHNDGRIAYQPGTPDVFRLHSPRSPRSLYPLSGSQLAGEQARVKAEGQSVIRLVGAEVYSSQVAPGGAAFGLIAFDVPAPPPGSGPTVLRFLFPADSAGAVSALLVL